MILKEQPKSCMRKVVTRCSFNTVDTIQVNMVPRWWCGSQYANHFSSLDNNLGPRSVPLPRITDNFPRSPEQTFPSARAESVHEVVQCGVWCAKVDLQCSVQCAMGALHNCTVSVLGLHIPPMIVCFCFPWSQRLAVPAGDIVLAGER